MPRKKIYYKYWELPNWDNNVVHVNTTFEHNGKIYLSLVDGEKIYKISRPKRVAWKKVRTGNNIVVTKHLRQEKMAVLELIAIEE